MLIGRAIGSSIGTGVWMYFSALAVLTGAELNGELLSRRVAAMDCNLSEAAEANRGAAQACRVRPAAPPGGRRLATGSGIRCGSG